MKNYSQILLIAACSIILLKSCINQERQVSGVDTENLTAFKNINIDIPRHEDGTPVLKYLIKKHFEKNLSIDELENGFDSIQIRIWYGYSSNHTAKLLIIKNSNQIWSAKFTDLISQLDETGDSLMSVKTSYRNATPRSGWSSFTKKLFELQILSLPNMSDISGDISIAHGDAFTVEFATTSRYRFYQYVSPEFVKDRLWQAGKMDQILQLIKSELNCY